MSRYELENALKLSDSLSSYLAFDSHLGMDVVLNFIKLNSMTGSFAKKTAFKLCSLQELKIPGTPSVTDFGFTETELFYAYQTVQAVPVPQNIDSSSLVNLFIDACEILDNLHKNSIIHGQISNESFMMNVDGKAFLSETAIDFCDISLAFERFTCLSYWSPERILNRKATVSSDLYALGAVLYKILAGRLPFDELDIESQLSKIFYQRPKLLRELDFNIPKRLETICLKLLEKDPDARYQSANRLMFDLRNFIDGGTNDSLRQQILSKPFLPLVGRANETQYFRNALQRASCENGSTLDLTINSGMGNSRLIQEFRIVAIANGAIFIHASHDRTTLNIPAISQTLDDLSNHQAHVDIELAEHLAASLHVLSPSFADSMGLDVSNSEQIRDSSALAKEVASLLADIMPEITVVYAFENVTDPLTKEVIQNLSRLAEKKNIVVIVTHPPKTDIAKKTDLIQRHELPPLDEAEISELTSQLCAVKLPYDEIHELKKLTGGNPYHCTLLLDYLVKGEITTLRQAPRQLRELQEKKWSGTSELGKHLLLRLSLFGKPVKISFLKLASDLKKEEFNIAFNELQDNGFIKESLAGAQSVVKLSSEGLAPLIKSTIPKNTEFIHYLHMAQSVEEHKKDNQNLDFELGQLYFLANNCSKAASYFIKILKSPDKQTQTLATNEVIVLLESCIEHIQEPLILFETLIVALKNQIAARQLEKVRKYSLQVQELFKRHDFGLVEQAKAFSAIAESELLLGNLDKSFAVLSKLKPIADRNEYPEAKHKHLELTSRCHISQKQGLEAQETCAKLIDNCVERQDKQALFAAYCMMAEATELCNDHEEAIHWLQKAISLAKNISSIMLERQAIDLIANIQFKSGNIAQGIEALRHTIDIEKDSRGLERQAQAYSRMSNVLLEHSKISELRAVLTSFGDFLEENDTQKCKTEYLMGMIQLAITDMRFEDALEWIRKLEDLSLTLGSPPTLLKAMQLKGEVFVHLGDHLRAESMLKLAFELFETQSRELALKDHAKTCYLISKNCISLNKIDDARECFQQGKKLEKELLLLGMAFEPMISNIAKLCILKALYCSKETVSGFTYAPQTHFNRSKWVNAYEFSKSVLDKKTYNDFYTCVGLTEFILVTAKIIHERFLLSNVKDHEAIIYSKFAKEKMDLATSFLVANGITLHKSEFEQLKEDILRLKSGRLTD